MLKGIDPGMEEGPGKKLFIYDWFRTHLNGHAAWDGVLPCTALFLKKRHLTVI